MKCIWCRKETEEATAIGGMHICKKCSNIPLWKAYQAAKRACESRKFYTKGASQ